MRCHLTFNIARSCVPRGTPLSPSINIVCVCVSSRDQLVTSGMRPNTMFWLDVYESSSLVDLIHCSYVFVKVSAAFCSDPLARRFSSLFDLRATRHRQRFVVVESDIDGKFCQLNGSNGIRARSPHARRCQRCAEACGILEEHECSDC